MLLLSIKEEVKNIGTSGSKCTNGDSFEVVGHHDDVGVHGDDINAINQNDSVEVNEEVEVVTTNILADFLSDHQVSFESHPGGDVACVAEDRLRRRSGQSWWPVA
jgi:hypothetical protein